MVYRLGFTYACNLRGPGQDAMTLWQLHRASFDLYQPVVQQGVAVYHLDKCDVYSELSSSVWLYLCWMPGSIVTEI